MAVTALAALAVVGVMVAPPARDLARVLQQLDANDDRDSDVHVYVISMPNSTERRAAMEAQVNRSNYSFVDAVVGKDLPDDERRNLTKDVVCNVEGTYAMRPGEIGCFLSHVKALKQVANGTTAWGLILEDDALLEDGWLQKLKNVVLELDRNEPSVLFCGHDEPYKFYTHPLAMVPHVTPYLTSPHEDRAYSVSSVRAAGRLNMHAYAVSKEGAAALLSKFATILCPCDFQMHFSSTREAVDVFALKEGFASQRSVYSNATTGTNGTNGTAAPWFESSTNPHTTRLHTAGRRSSQFTEHIADR